MAAVKGMQAMAVVGMGGKNHEDMFVGIAREPSCA
jgi:hypothetical protein